MLEITNSSALDVKIVIAVNKRDVWFCRICVASIRYYYPDVKIALIKDYLNGHFNTKEIERAFNVSVLDLGIKKYGWAVSKLHVILSEKLKEQKILLLDSDIVFVGKFLQKLLDEGTNYDFSVDADFMDDCHTDWVKRTYYDLIFFQSLSPDFQYPGYLFNTGQMLISPGVLKNEDISVFFDITAYPFWKNRGKLPTVDQSLLNYILPYKEQKSEITIHKAKFMIWSESAQAKQLSIVEITNGNNYPFLIHWAGAKRTPNIEKMTRADILFFFQNEYYKQISFGKLKIETRKIMFELNSYYLRAKNKISKIINEKNRKKVI